VTHLVLTGDLHVGKTTVCRAVVELARQRGYSVRGILTTPILDKAGERLGFTVLNLAGAEQRELARVERPRKGGTDAERLDYGGPSVGPFHFDPAVLQWGYDIVAQAIVARCDLLVVDEVGRLELEQNTGFGRALDLVATSAVQRILLVVRSSLLDAFRRRWPQLSFATFEVTADNRDVAPGIVAERLSLI